MPRSLREREAMSSTTSLLTHLSQLISVKPANLEGLHYSEAAGSAVMRACLAVIFGGGCSGSFSRSRSSSMR